MPSSWNFFWDAFRLIVSQPKLFLPKLLLAVLYGLLMLETARFSLTAIPLGTEKALTVPFEQAQALLGQAVLLLLTTLMVFVVDVWISSWYPILVSDYRQKRLLSFQSAIRESWKRFSTVLPLMLGFEVVIAVLLGLFLNAAFFLLPVQGFLFSLLIGLLIIFLVMVAFYPMLSVGILEKKNIWGSLRRTVSLSKQNWKIFSIAALIPFFISLANFGLAFVAEKTEFMALFWVARIGLALVITYNTVVNPAAYFAAVETELE